MKSKKKIDLILLSPGINIDKCKLSKYLKKDQEIFIPIWMYLIHFIIIHVLQSLVRMKVNNLPTTL